MELEEKIKRMEEEAINSIENISEENIKKSQKQLQDIKTAEYLEKLNELEDKLKRCAERMKIDKERGNTAGEAEEHSRYSYIVELITELKENRIKELENMVSRDSRGLGETLEDCDKKIAELELKSKEIAQRMRADKEYGNYAGEAQAHAEFNEVIQQINGLKNKKVSIIDNKIKQLEEEAKQEAQIMKADKEYGNYAGEAQAHSNYSNLIIEINELKKTRQNIINPNINKMINNTEVKKEEPKDVQEEVDSSKNKDDKENNYDLDEFFNMGKTKNSKDMPLEKPNMNVKIVFRATAERDLPYIIRAYENNEKGEMKRSEEYGDKYFYLNPPKRDFSAAYIGESYKEVLLENAMKYGISKRMQEKADPMMLHYFSGIDEKEAENMAKRIKR